MDRASSRSVRGRRSVTSRGQLEMKDECPAALTDANRDSQIRTAPNGHEDGGWDAALHSHPPDEVLDALESVIAGLVDNATRIEVALERAAQIKQQRGEGRTYSEIVQRCPGPLLVEILTTNLLVLHTIGHRLRTAEARALRDEGLSCRDIANLFGVSRQRVMALLRTPPADDGDDESRFQGAEDRQPANAVAAAP
jgi:hypothetical protein